MRAHYTRISELHAALKGLDKGDRLKVVEGIVADILTQRNRRGQKRRRMS